MTLRVFVDTNLWVYRLDKREPAKASRIGQWLRTLAQDHEVVVSTQVMIELRAVLARKFDPPLPAREVRTALAALGQLEVVPADTTLVLDADELARSEQLAWFDALIVEAAIRSGCERLYSEDLGHGRAFGGLIVCNPLRSAQD